MQRPRDHKDTLKIVNNPLTIYGQRIVNNPLTISKHLIIKTIEIVRILYCGRRQAPFQSQNMPQVTADIFIEMATVPIFIFSPLNILSYRPVEAKHLIIYLYRSLYLAGSVALGKLSYPLCIFLVKLH